MYFAKDYTARFIHFIISYYVSMLCGCPFARHCISQLYKQRGHLFAEEPVEVGAQHKFQFQPPHLSLYASFKKMEHFLLASDSLAFNCLIDLGYNQHHISSWQNKFRQFETLYILRWSWLTGLNLKCSHFVASLPFPFPSLSCHILWLVLIPLPCLRIFYFFFPFLFRNFFSFSH